VLDNAPMYLMFFANALGGTGLSIEEPAAVQEFLARGKAEMAATFHGRCFVRSRDLHRQ
jgi:hypothetical protein